MAYKNPEDEAAAKARWYQANKERHMANVQKNNAADIEWYKSLKHMKPCTDCGVAYPYYVMDWDHLGDKTIGVTFLRKRGRPKILAEIAKCELVCSNCHRARTHERLQRVTIPPKPL